MTEAYYLPAGTDRFIPTEATTSPWDPGSQHGGPPAALLATVLGDLGDPPDGRLARLAVDFLGPIPRRESTVAARLVRPGRKVRLTEATMAVDGRTVVVARAWHIAVGDGLPAAIGRPKADADAPPPLPPSADEAYFPGTGRWGYGESVEWRFVTGGFGELGPGRVWTRVRIPLVAGRPLSGLQRMVVVADSANGLSAELALDRWLVVPPSLTVTAYRHPPGDWVHLSARTRLSGDGLGLAHADLADGDGVLGVATQPLLVAAR